MFTMMKVHPSSKKRTNHRSQNAIVSSSSNNPNTNTNNNKNKLWRLPHVFASVLELPLHSDDDVSIEETPQFLRFVASCKCRGSSSSSSCGVSAEAVEIVPGIIKIVIKGINGGDYYGFAEQCYGFRFRLPPWTRPEMAAAVCTGGKLVVTVPKTKSRGN